MLGYAAARPTSFHLLIGDEQLARFVSLSAVHGDGWGTSWLAADAADNAPERVRTHRSPDSADGDPLFRTHAETVLSTARLAHLRWATVGFPVALRNTHPFHTDGMSFAHNGKIASDGELDELLAGHGQTELAGDTDSERYFALVRGELRTDPTETPSAVLRAATALRGRYPNASLNAMLLTGTELVIVHANALASNPVKDLRAMPGEPPTDHLSAYFLMRWRRTADGSLVFVSSGIDAQGWQPLPEESVTTVDLRSLTMRTVTISPLPLEPAA
ncbi:class II glutamine amidotransferase [Streptomyces sp. NBC_00481]|uniref:class II glutamine amidotransferase n=1 Tax=unclassified Streptomyces TaxID=2593676 RepID=UPI002DDB1E81|nr:MULTISPECIES: class II glutamine amidotransferase [unclassified Streptomyces]WRZ00426.1 class II glutamine amidotransferase [Streptomyces sp. NBC_00481]